MNSITGHYMVTSGHLRAPKDLTSGRKVVNTLPIGLWANARTISGTILKNEWRMDLTSVSEMAVALQSTATELHK